MKKLLTGLIMCALAFGGASTTQALNWVYVGDVPNLSSGHEESVFDQYVDVDSIRAVGQSLQFIMMAQHEDGKSQEMVIQYNDETDKVALKQEMRFIDEDLVGEKYIMQKDLDWRSYPVDSAMGDAINIVDLTLYAELVDGYWGGNPLFAVVELPSMPSGNWLKLYDGLEVDPDSIMINEVDAMALVWTRAGGDNMYYWCLDGRRQTASIVAIASVGENNVIDANITRSNLWIPYEADYYSESPIIATMLETAMNLNDYLLFREND